MKTRFISVSLWYLKSGYPCCVRCIYDESYRDIQFFSIKYCSGGLPRQHPTFQEEVLVSCPPEVCTWLVDHSAGASFKMLVTRWPQDWNLT